MENGFTFRIIHEMNNWHIGGGRILPIGERTLIDGHPKCHTR